MLRKVMPFVDFIYYFPIVSAREEGSAGEGEATVTQTTRSEGRRVENTRRESSPEPGDGALEKRTAPAFCRSPGIKLKAGGRGEKSLRLPGVNSCHPTEKTSALGWL